MRRRRRNELRVSRLPIARHPTRTSPPIPSPHPLPVRPPDKARSATSVRRRSPRLPDLPALSHASMQRRCHRLRSRLRARPRPPHAIPHSPDPQAPLCERAAAASRKPEPSPEPALRFAAPEFAHPTPASLVPNATKPFHTESARPSRPQSRAHSGPIVPTASPVPVFPPKPSAALTATRAPVRSPQPQLLTTAEPLPRPPPLPPSFDAVQSVPPSIG